VVKARLTVASRYDASMIIAILLARGGDPLGAARGHHAMLHDHAHIALAALASIAINGHLDDPQTIGAKEFHVSKDNRIFYSVLSTLDEEPHGDGKAEDEHQERPLAERIDVAIACRTGKLFDKKVELGDREVMLSNGLLIDRDLNSAINIYRRWYENHIAAVAPPPGTFVPGVLERSNLFKEPSLA
jgi:hypothetical protein